MIYNNLNRQQFQFLIGTLKTFFLFGVVENRIVVSIPYRYAKNVFAVGKKR